MRRTSERASHLSSLGIGEAHGNADPTPVYRGRGNNRSRLALVALVTVYYGLLAWNNARLALSGALPAVAESKAWATVARSLFWMAINLWYFLGKRPRAFYAQA